jgi:hypothetical protein
MTKIERLEAALEWVLGSPLPGNSQLVRVSVDQILNPPPEYEVVEESAGWVNVYPAGYSKGGRLSVFTTKEEADHYGDLSSRIDCQEIKVKVRREKVAPAERSVYAEDVLMSDGMGGVALRPHGVSLKGDVPPNHWMGLDGKRGTFTFTWQEDPPK